MGRFGRAQRLYSQIDEVSRADPFGGRKKSCAGGNDCAETRGRQCEVNAAGGILSANGIYFALSATSLGAIIAASARFFAAAKWVGAAYLIYLGIKALRLAQSSHAVVLSANPAARDGALRGVYLGALTLQLANPKALLFFLALLPQFIDPARPVVPQMLILAATSMVPEFCILTGYGWLAHRAAHSAVKFGVAGGVNRWLARIEGAGLLGCATLVLRFNRGGT